MRMCIERVAAARCRKTVSVVLPCFNEEENVRAVIGGILGQGALNAYDLEIICVDDGSTDQTWNAIRDVCREHSCVNGIRLSRNFGHQAALFAGIEHAKGDAVIMMDADMQHPPETLPGMVSAWEDGAEIVNAVRTGDEALNGFKRHTSALFYRVFRALTGLPLASGQADFRLMDARVLRVLLEFKERTLFLRGLVSWVGFRQKNLFYRVDRRRAGQSGYRLRHMIRFALDAAVAFSDLPLKLGLSMGLLATAVAFSYGLYAIIVRLFLGHVFKSLVPGWASLAALMSFLFGLLFIQLGILGEYVAHVYRECKNRPRFIIAETLGGADVSTGNTKQECRSGATGQGAGRQPDGN